MADRYPDDPIEYREFQQVHGSNEREDWERSWRYKDEGYRTRKPAALLELEDEAA